MAVITFQQALDRLAAFEAATESDVGRRVSTLLGQGLTAAQKAAARANIGAAARDEVVLKRGRQTVFGDVTFERPVAVPAGSIPQDRVTDLTADLASKLDAADIAGKADDNAVVKLTTDQTVAGVKTFSSAPVVPDGSFAQAKVANLTTDLAAKAADSTVVKLTTDQTVAGVKTFSSAPVVPDGSFAQAKITGLPAALTQVASRNRFTPEQYGAVGDGVADDTVAVRQCLEAANACRIAGLGGNIWRPAAVVEMRGTYKLTSIATPLIASCNLNAAGAALVTPKTYGNVVLICGHETPGMALHTADMVLPDILGERGDAGHTAGGVGVRFNNLMHSLVKVGRIIYFETGQHWTGDGRGTVYNSVHPGNVDVCKVAMRFDSGPNGTGWPNQNTFYGGGITQSHPGWGLPVYRAPGWRHIVMDGENGVNGFQVQANTFVGFSLEGALSEYQIDLKRASDNQWIGCTRFEQGTLGDAVTVSTQFNSLSTAAAHNLALHDQILIQAATMPEPLIQNRIYYAKPLTGSTDLAVLANVGDAVGIDITTAGAGVKLLRPPRIRVDNTDTFSPGNRIHSGWWSWPGPIEVVQIGPAHQAANPEIDFLTNSNPFEATQAGGVYRLPWNGSAWTFKGAALTARPTSRTDIYFDLYGAPAATADPAWMLATDSRTDI